MESVLRELKLKGIRVTPQRVAIYETLCHENIHLTAEEIYGKIKLQIPAVSLATVYQSLILFKDRGLIAELRIKPGRSCFEGRMEVHHHFLCRVCGLITDLDLKPCQALESREVDGHCIESLHGYFYGICRSCRKKGNNESD